MQIIELLFYLHFTQCPNFFAIRVVVYTSIIVMFIKSADTKRHISLAITNIGVCIWWFVLSVLILISPCIFIPFSVSLSVLIFQSTFLLHQIATNSSHCCHLSCTLSTNQILVLFIAGCISERRRDAMIPWVASTCAVAPTCSSVSVRPRSYNGGFPTRHDAADTCHHSGWGGGGSDDAKAVSTAPGDAQEAAKYVSSKQEALYKREQS